MIGVTSSRRLTSRANQKTGKRSLRSISRHSKIDWPLNMAPEYVPFIEAYAQTGNWQKAYDLTLAAQKLTSNLETMLCDNWSRLNQLSSPDVKIIDQVKQALSCKNF